MVSTLRPIGHEDTLSLVDHLDELRTRLIVCVAALVVVFGVAFWQNAAVLDFLNKPLADSAFKKSNDDKDPFEQTQIFAQAQKRLYLQQTVLYRDMARTADSPQTRERLTQLAKSAAAAARLAPQLEAKKPVTLGVGEPFNQTFKVAFYAALLVTLPLLLYEAYAFLLPAFSAREREVAVPLMAMVPFLFFAGVAFGYFIALPPAIDFLQNFNDKSFDILVQANAYYGFSILVLVSLGVVFQIPVGLLAANRMGVISGAQMRGQWRIAIVGLAVLAMLLPGQTPVSFFACFLPLLALFGLSILLVAFFERRDRRRAVETGTEMSAANDAELMPLDPDDEPDEDDDPDPDPDART